MTLTEFQLDGRLRAVTSTPSGLSSGVPTSNGWSVHDYEGNFSDQTNSIEMNFYARKDDIPDIECNDQDHSNGQMEDCVTVCRVSLTFQLEEHVKVQEMSATIESRDSFIFISGTVAQASYNKTYSLDSQSKLKDMSIESRSAILRKLTWIRKLEIQGGYVAVPF
ncbi:uncharacterized protein PHALS_04555 [Plasmopara halstedii]|uniref:Uncharacterized protein n=1 Tax=Plasmopara halstedii TaxID=4781 RepID=A0A0P1A8S7_PLAHL|nr:uncharacterized protein PHALS_04555 [Plasmopara halstedii]CEG37096.1 hypothetical protein PHALS_04555 [Plasmopara halstedii]|eukprot:XP_024573465.1 hypothetical protein PHALS_04555 [Plasmopara halstedii]